MIDRGRLPELLAAMLPIAAAAWLLFSARRRREGEGPHCLMCGYNLAGADHTHCPECGQVLTPERISDGPPAEMNWQRFIIGLVILLGTFAWVLWGYFVA